MFFTYVIIVPVSFFIYLIFLIILYWLVSLFHVSMLKNLSKVSSWESFTQLSHLACDATNKYFHQEGLAIFSD